MTDEQAPAEDVAFEADDAAQEIEALKLEVANLKDQALRYLADAENTKRRAEREMNDARAYAITKFARDLLGAADIFDRAMAAAPVVTDGPMKNFIVGVEMTAKELQGAFDRNGLKRIEPARGEKFDPHKHQAMMEQPGEDVAPGSVISVMQPGYELLGRLVRPAMVVVAAKGAAPASAANPYGDGGEGGEPDGGSFDTRA